MSRQTFQHGSIGDRAVVTQAARPTAQTTALITKAGGKAIAVVCDLGHEDQVQKMVADGVKAFGKITTLVNNAGDGGPTKKVEEYTMEDWRYTLI